MSGSFWPSSTPPPPLKFSCVGHGLAELAVGLGFGPVIVLGTFYVQTQAVSYDALWASTATGLLIAAILYINEFPDYAADKAVGKNTLIVVVGRERDVPGVDLLHTPSLVHDDINDQSAMRRRQATINARWGNRLALLTGDFLFVKLLGLIAGFDSRVIHLLADSCHIRVEGEALQIQALTRGNAGMTPQLCLRIVKQKTASLFSACAELGGLLAEGRKPPVTALRNYGLNLGMAFQIRDDTLDLTDNGEDPRKPATGDLEQDKMILAALSALERSARAREVLVPTDSPRPIEQLSDAWALEYALETAREYSDRPRKTLSVLPGSEATATLCELVDLAVARNQ